MSEKNDHRPVSRHRPRLKHGLLPDLLGYNLRAAQFAVYASLEENRSRFNISPGQFAVMILINENADVSQSALAETMSVDRSTMVAVIDKLEARGLVVRAAAQDRRSHALRLTAAGKALLLDLEQAAKLHDSRISACLSDSERAQLIEMLQRIRDNLAR